MSLIINFVLLFINFVCILITFILFSLRPCDDE